MTLAVVKRQAEFWRTVFSSERRLLFSLLIGLVTIYGLMGWYTWKQHEEFKAQQWSLMSESVDGAEQEIGTFVKEQRRRVKLFATEERALLSRLAAEPENERIYQALADKLNIHFPRSFAFTLADENGTLLYEDFKEFVGEQCLNDIHAFAQHGAFDNVIVHPGPQVYHFDIMAPWLRTLAGKPGVFFVSFKLEIITRLLANHQRSKQRLILVSKVVPGLIEATALGARNELEREPFLTPQEKNSIGASLPVRGTRWDLVAVADLKQFDKELGRLLQENAVVSAFVTIVLVSIWLVMVEVRRRRAAVQSWVQTEEQLKLLLESTAEGIFGVDLKGICTFCNPAAARMLGYRDQTEILGKSMHSLIHHTRPNGQAYPENECRICQTIHNKKGTHADDEVLWRSDGTSFSAEYWSYPIRKAGQLVGAVVTFVDITVRKRAERNLHEEKERALVTLHSIGDAVITADVNGIVEYLNPVAESLSGWSLDEAHGLSLNTVFYIVNEQDHEPILNPVIRCLEEGHSIGSTNHSILISRDGRRHSIQYTAAPIRGRDGKVFGLIVVFKDVSEARRMAQKIAHQAAHDALTGLINRHSFEERLQRVLETAQEEQTSHALCYLDLDQFKVVNDTCGHMAGDELLRQLGALMQTKIRTRDTLARLGGDEFGVLMEHCPLKQAWRVAEALRRTIEKFRFLWEDKAFGVGVSIGLVGINEASESVTSVLQAADSACYVAKDKGRNRIHVYRQDDADLVRRHGEMQWVERIHRAIEEDRFQLCFQPIIPVNDQDHQRGHYELLLRMKEGDHSVLPGAFLPAAERYNIIEKIDRWVLDKALNWFACHPTLLERLILCAINLSGQSLGNEEFLAFVSRRFDETGIPPAKICFEVTETAAIGNLAEANRFIKALGRRGCRFALDDFGSGLSSFAYLNTLPVDFIKIDGAFVKTIVDDPIHLAMVRSINEIGQVMGKQTIAEFVESKTILELLRGLGINYAQGYRIGRPRPIEEMCGH